MYIFDLHCDTLLKFHENPDYSFQNNNGHISEAALTLGSYMAECFAIYLPSEIPRDSQYMFFKKQYNRFTDIVDDSCNLKRAKSKKDIIRNSSRGKISAVLTVENADFLGNDLKKLKIAENLGVKILGLIWNNENCLGYPNSSNKKLGNLPLKPFGRQVVYRLNYSNMIADVSHLNSGGFNDVAAISKGPFIASHSACRDVYEHPRNLYDHQIRKIANSGGVVGMVFYPKFLNGTNTAALCDIIRHFKHLIKVGGEDIAAIGTDFDGMDGNLFLKNASDMPYFADALIKEFGFSVAEKICYKNALRLL